MGFSFMPPRPEPALAVRGIDQWSQRAELALIHEAPPWQALLAGQSPVTWLNANRLQLVQYLRAKNLKVVWMHDLTDGLDRAREEPQLILAGRSLKEPATLQLLRQYVLAVADMLDPDYTGLAAETNLIRLLAPGSVYAAVVTAANTCATDLQKAGYRNPLLVSVQAETAWGWLSGGPGFVGMDRDVADFPFVQMWGLSSYPYFYYDHPTLLPPDYYSRLVRGLQLPVMVTEGGWPSVSVGNLSSNAATQAAYLQKQAQLLDSVQAAGVLQIMYADLDLNAFPMPQPPNLQMFGTLGVVDSNFTAKPALKVWDANFARPRGF